MLNLRAIQHDARPIRFPSTAAGRPGISFLGWFKVSGSFHYDDWSSVRPWHSPLNRFAPNCQTFWVGVVFSFKLKSLGSRFLNGAKRSSAPARPRRSPASRWDRKFQVSQLRSRLNSLLPSGDRVRNVQPNSDMRVRQNRAVFNLRPVVDKAIALDAAAPRD